MYSDSDFRGKSEYELLRERNIREREAFLSTVEDAADFTNAVKEINEFGNSLNSKPLRKRKRRSSDEQPFKFSGKIPVERRRSSRLAKLPPQPYNENLPVKPQRKRQQSSHSRTGKSSKAVLAVIVPVESITDEQIRKIAYSGKKTYCSTYGKTCHQCRQKTLDTKSVCRSGECTGISGQFCGQCLKNRYGEIMSEVLKDPNWICPVCRGLCNCSFCRHKAGRRPTGILVPIAQQYGCSSVREFLDNYVDEDGCFIKISSNNGNDEVQQVEQQVEEQQVEEQQVEEAPSESYLLGFNEQGECVME